MAAQIVSGIGFIGGGVIFVRKDLVRGLTTATTIWVTSAVGMACGTGLPLLAVAVTAANFVVVFGFRPLERWLPKSRWAPSSLHMSYEDGRGILRDILTVCTHEDFAVTGVEVERKGDRSTERRGKQSGKARAMEPAYAVAAGLEEGEDFGRRGEADRDRGARTARRPIPRQARRQAQRNRWRVRHQFGRGGFHVRLTPHGSRGLPPHSAAFSGTQAGSGFFGAGGFGFSRIRRASATAGRDRDR